MKKPEFKYSIDWKSKFMDLIIVIVGITIAFKLNTWNESTKSSKNAAEYVKSFTDENVSNQQLLASVLEFSEANKKEIETLKNLLVTGDYEDTRINNLVATMMELADFSPMITAFENITASGEFELIRDSELRKQIINTYNGYKTTDKFENILMDYVNEYVTPYFFEYVRFSDFNAVDSEFIRSQLFENIVTGYEILLSQQIRGYRDNLKKANNLSDRLNAVNYR